MIFYGGVAVVAVLFWLRMRFHRNRFNRALKAMDRGGVAQRAASAFWKVVGVCLLIAVGRMYLEMHAR